MSTLNISLPDSMRKFVDRLVARGECSTASEYVRQLIREDQRRRFEEEIEMKLLESLREKAEPLTEATWRSIRQDGRKILKSLKRR